jgi:peptidoglycan-N-acetylglucosamine deacetylase
MFTPVRPPYLLRKFYSEFTWDIPVNGPEVFLTFDDGPTPGVTEFVLDTLKQHLAKATFFCIGKNVQQHPELFERIKAEGHRTGNHTYQHLNGWITSAQAYKDDVKEASRFITTDLFRPPYGRLKKSQARDLLPIYRVVMWDVLSFDWDPTVTPETCLSNVINHIRAGSIIVFHDSQKAFPNLKYALPRVLEYLSEKKYSSLAIT